MTNLVVPKPVFNLKAEDYIDGFVKVDKPIQVECGRVKYANGSTVNILEATKFGFYVYREEYGQTKIWDKNTAAWKPETSVSAENKELNMFMFDDKDLNIPWKGVFVAIGEKYLSDNSSSVPQFFIRCYFEATDSKGVSHSGTSNPSMKIRLAKLGSDYKVGLDTEKRDLAKSNWIRLFVKDSSRQLIGEIKLKRESEIGEIELISYDDNNNPQSFITLDKYGELELVGGSNTGGDKAKIRLKSNGEIELESKPALTANKTNVYLNKNGEVKIAVANNDVLIIESGKVTIKGNLVANNISYIPHPNWPRKWL